MRMARSNRTPLLIEDVFHTIEQSLQPDDHAIFKAINEWERHSIGKIQLAAEEAHNDLRRWFNKKREDVFQFLIRAQSQIGSDSTTTDLDLTKLNNQIRRLREDLLGVTSSIHLEHDKTKAPIYLIQFVPKSNYRADENTNEETIDVPGTRLLTLPMIRNLSHTEQKQMLGERLFVLVQQIEPMWAAKITGMFLEWDIRYILILIQSHADLKEQVRKAVLILRVHQYRQRQVVNSQ